MSEADPADAELVLAFRAGDPEAYAALVRRYVRLGGAVAYQVLGDYEQAADALQDAFLKVHGAIDGLREPERFRSWFHGVVRTVAIDHRRRRKRQPGSLAEIEEAQEAAPFEDDPVDALAVGECREQVLAAIAELPERYREVVALKYLDERSYQEVAELLGTTADAVESRLHRARRALREKLRGFARKSGLV